MRATRLSAAAVATGALVLGMAGPVLADSPGPVHPGAFCSPAGATGKTAKGTPMVCAPGSDGKLRWKSGKGPTPPTTHKPLPPTTPKPVFRFGFDKVRLSSRVVAPGRHTTFTVSCPSAVTITSNGYTRNPLPVRKTGKATWTASGTFKSSLPDPTVATVVCKGFGSVKYSTHPSKNPSKGGNSMQPTTPKIPNGRIDTGDGSMYRPAAGSGAPLLAIGWGALAAAGLGAVALRRRTARERSTVA
ncbi:hypothetical protein [Actinomadura verrucosospora]|uniref:Uncharacterized protein n=1 Tax=Actinomadura verrucosospora TaxID=46165 RepID=A0A7D3VVC8_ACTVE|nr:hypothetical protein [Actinomadura verrucosospora]QKG24040.1 hypothetical protein ACTIVE_5683 [Actinomadura verrucosospora]